MARENAAQKAAREATEAQVAAERAAAEKAAQDAQSNEGDQTATQDGNGAQSDSQDGQETVPDPINDPTGGELKDFTEIESTGVSSSIFETSPMHQETEKWDHKVQEPDGLIILPGEEVVFEGELEGNYLRVKRDVFQKVYPHRARRPNYVLKHRKGSLVPANSVVRKESEDDSEGTFGNPSTED